MSEPQFDERLDAVLSMLKSIASLDFTRKLKLSSKADKIDAVAAGLNMLSEELKSNVIKRTELEEINKNLERFASIAAHDMKSPLSALVSLTNLLEDELQDHPNKQVVEYLDMLRVTNNKMNKLIMGILEYSKTTLTVRQMLKIDLGKLFHKSAALYSTNEWVVISIGEGMPVVQHSETALTQIINNLLDNAVKYNDKEICQIEIQCTDQGDQYVISIADNGPGILPDDREKIFDLFENLKTERENSIGIGLATVKKIVTDTNGRIWVEPSENQGAKFVFTIKKED
ncbi:MAG: GHKL domain-containing protein [Bacteroidetes bacterium]|nr:GHKL domain-containing protein [Bacteroidota bacterium]